MTRLKRGNLVNRLATLMEANVRALKISSADKEIVEAYEAVVRFVREEGERILPESTIQKHSKETLPSNSDVARLSIDEVEGLIARAELPRANLEQIAIYRFGVPRGSMRSWSRKEDLREKVLTMLRNERVHRTIEEVAKSKTHPPAD